MLAGSSELVPLVVHTCLLASKGAAVILRLNLSGLNFVDTFPWAHLRHNVYSLRPWELLIFLSLPNTAQAHRPRSGTVPV